MWVIQTQPFRQEDTMAEMSPLRRRMLEDMAIRNLSPATQRSCSLTLLPIVLHRRYPVCTLAPGGLRWSGKFGQGLKLEILL
jgi:hypothetical protein